MGVLLPDAAVYPYNESGSRKSDSMTQTRG
jgi:hypothetical protein